MICLFPLLLGSAVGAGIDFRPATIGSDTVLQINAPTKLSYRDVQAAYPYITIKAVNHLPTDSDFKSACWSAVLDGLKTPGAARQVSMAKTGYFTKGGYYLNNGVFDSQNSYGALLRGDFFCMSVYDGNRTGGVVYTSADLSTRK